jgi:hypothetical protein
MGARQHGGMDVTGKSNSKRTTVVVLGLLACSILQQCTVAAALTQADDATVLLQFQQQYGVTAEGWAGDSPCGVTLGELCLHAVVAAFDTHCQSSGTAHTPCTLRCRRGVEPCEMLS